MKKNHQKLVNRMICVLMASTLVWSDAAISALAAGPYSEESAVTTEAVTESLEATLESATTEKTTEQATEDTMGTTTEQSTEETTGTTTEQSTEDTTGTTTEQTTEETTETTTEQSTEETTTETESIISKTQSGLTQSESMTMSDWLYLTDYKERLKEAQESLQKSAAEKEIYALIYLTESYNVKVQPGSKKGTVASLASGHTVRITGVDVDWNILQTEEVLYGETGENSSATGEQSTTEAQNSVADQSLTGEAVLAEETSEEEITVENQNIEDPTIEAQTIEDNQNSAAETTAERVTRLPDIWYQVEFYVGEELMTGYVEHKYLACSDEILLQWEETYNDLFSLPGIAMLSATANGVDYSDIECFPSSYQYKLKALKAAHPNWTFVAQNTGEDWTESVVEQRGKYSWIWKTAQDSFKGAQINSNWYYATDEAIAYYMDPRNFFDSTYIFQFEQNTYNASYHTQGALQSFLNNTFMKGIVPGNTVTYANLIWTTGKNRNLSPFNLAARIVQEQGSDGSSAMISGTYTGYSGYYNHFNIGASGKTDAEVLKNGLTYARNKGWNTRTKSIVGGADFIGNGYILKGQDTLYLQKFDLEKRSGSLHQYMQNIGAPSSEGFSMSKMYREANSLDSRFVFKIPVFTGMPGTSYSLNTSKVRLDKTKAETKSVLVRANGVTLDTSDFQYTVADTTIASVTTDGLVTPKKNGKTTIKIVNRDQSKEIISLTCTVEVYSSLSSISLNTTQGNLNRGDTENLTVSYEPEDTTDSKTVTWSTSNSKVATVTKDTTDSSKAVVKAIGEGTAKITARVSNHTAVYNITVTVRMEDASLNKQELALYSNQHEQLSVQYTPVDTTDSTAVTWYSSNPEVATVKNGMVKAIAPGTAVISASISSFTNTLEAMKCSVTVKACNVTFYDELGEVFLSEDLSYGQKLEDLISDAPWQMQEKENAHFAGWYTGENATGENVSKDTTVYADMKLYPCYKETDKGFFVKPVGDMTYTGAAIKPVVEVYDQGVRLTEKQDYVVSYLNNVQVNDASVAARAPQVVVTGRGNYSQRQTTAFKIVPKDISQEDILVTELLATYNGRTQKLYPVVMRDGKKLVRGRDYNVTFPQEKSAGAYARKGTYDVCITGIKGYTGSRTVHLTITECTLVQRLSILSIRNQEYTGSAIEPKLTVRYGRETLTEGTDYELSYKNNTQIGTATVTIAGCNAYAGTRDVSFRITGTQMNQVKIAGITAKDYTGEPILQECVLTDRAGKELSENQDYTVTYQKNTDCGTATIIFTGINAYTGTVRRSFRINAYDIAKNTQVYDGTKPAFANDESVLQAVYQKNGATPDVNITYKGIQLVKGKDYTLSYRNHTAVNDGTDERRVPTITIRGRGNFKGSVTKNFTVTASDISDEELTMTAKDVVFRARKNAWKSTPVLTDRNQRRLTVGTDYERTIEYCYASQVTLVDGTIRKKGDLIEASDIPTPGELADALICVTVTGIKNYTGTKSCTYRLTPQSISGASVKIDRQYYISDGVAVEPLQSDMMVTVSGVQLSDSDYEIIKYENNTKRGNAKVTLRGCGNYSGEKTITFQIVAKKISLWENTPTDITAVFSSNNTLVINTNYTGVSYELPAVTISSQGYTAGHVQADYTEGWRMVIRPKSRQDTSKIHVSLQNDKFSVQADSDAGAGYYDLIFYPKVRVDGTMKELKAITQRILIDTTLPQLKLSKTQVILYTNLAGEIETVKTGVSDYSLVNDSLQIKCTSFPETIQTQAAAEELFTTSIQSGIISLSLAQGKTPVVGSYTFEIGAAVLIGEENRQLASRTIGVKVVRPLTELLANKDRSSRQRETNLNLRSAYQATMQMNQYDKQVIKANDLDFSEVTIACLGDSITAGNGLENSGGKQSAFPAVLKNILGAKEVYNLGYGGYAISDYWSSLLDVYQNIPSDSDIILVLAGINDCYAGNAGNLGSLSELDKEKTFYGDTDRLMKKLKERYPQAEVIFMTPLSSVTTQTYKNTLPDMLPFEKYATAIKQVASIEGVKVIDLYNQTFLDSFDTKIKTSFVPDGVHPNSQGHKMLAEKLASELIDLYYSESE